MATEGQRTREREGLVEEFLAAATGTAGMTGIDLAGPPVPEELLQVVSFEFSMTGATITGEQSQLPFLDVMTQMENRIQELESRVAALEQERQALGILEEEVIVLREISRDQAKQEIVQLFAEGETLYYSDIALHLRLPLPLVVELSQELQDQGEIRVDDDAL